ncbi:CBS domain-containing protein [Clostridium thermopalmarium]|uniref:Hypoxic response protein 1 n=1 Tax=Clostridium thermopalmarium DSM 5974 TaxID=1121340 RepID=A0A2T0AV04_9CLOT|nr:CBS domain-containing protein [Clostridium thermopalmarium]MBE6043798.1 CBS domain-containing protein [Clostridium thermopalmarium]PRR74419.1 Hypoxic response protein 1 [Clostridium thermopalmarium DSM 5974]PVZ21634.1 CBS domain-containing protein [Clostridium thermopalmarium DSM 5974]
MEIKNIMTKTVATINAEDTVERAAQMMKEYNVGSIPVCRGEKVVGVITDRDIALRSCAEGENARQQKVKDIMTSNPVTGTPNMDVHEAARIMSERQIRRLPIVENDKVVGIVALGDLAVEPQFANEAESALSSISTPASPQI